MKQVSSDALGLVQKAVGLAGRGAQITELLDGQLDQVLDVTSLIRRGRTQAATQGLYTPVLRNIHGAADSQASSAAPYALAAGEIAPWPVPVPDLFDVWLIGASVHQLSGTGTLSAMLTVNWTAAHQGWGVNQAGAAIVANVEKALAVWDALVTISVGAGILIGSNGPFAKIGLRLPRADDTTVIFRSTSSAIATFDCQLMMGIFPVGLGQDALI